jgi:hypothetical protein
MAFNNSLKRVTQRYLKAEIVSHDWWLYILNELVGGQTFYDKESTILYRQHSHSIVGANTGFLAKLKRIKMILNGTFRIWNTKHMEILNKIYIDDSRQNIEIIYQFFIQRDQSLMSRFHMIHRLGIYRQTWDEHLGLYVGAILHKL